MNLSMIRGWAEVHTASVAVDARVREGRLVVTVRYRLVAARTDRRPLAVEYAACPLEPVSIACDVASHGVNGDFAGHLVVLELARRASWNGATIDVVLAWPGVPRGPSLAPSSCLIVPDQLPRPVEWPKVSRLPAAEVAISADMDMQLVGYLGSHLDLRPTFAKPFRKAVLCLDEIPVAVRDQGMWPEIVLAGTSGTEFGPLIPEAVRAVASAAEFFGEHLSARPALRLAILTDATGDTAEGTFSPLLVAEPQRYAYPAPGSSGHPVHIGRLVAFNWWGAGLTIEGPNGNQLAIAMAVASALAWAEGRYPSEYFQRLLRRYRELADTTEAKWVHMRIGLPIYDWLRSDQSRWEVLTEILHSGWEQWQPQQRVIASLAKARLNLESILAEAPTDLSDYYSK